MGRGFLRMIFFQKQCGACKSKDEIIAYLKEKLDAERQDRLDERAEFKRTVDVLLMKNNLPPVGQGETKAAPQVDLEKAMGLMTGVGEDMTLKEIEEEKRMR